MRQTERDASCSKSDGLHASKVSSNPRIRKGRRGLNGWGRVEKRRENCTHLSSTQPFVSFSFSHEESKRLICNQGWGLHQASRNLELAHGRGAIAQYCDVSFVAGTLYWTGELSWFSSRRSFTVISIKYVQKESVPQQTEETALWNHKRVVSKEWYMRKKYKVQDNSLVAYNSYKIK